MSNETEITAMSKDIEYIKKSQVEHGELHRQQAQEFKDFKKNIYDKIDNQTIKLGEYIDNNFTSKIRDVGGELFANKETEKKVDKLVESGNSLIRKSFAWLIAVIIALSGIVAILINSIMK